MNDQDKMVLWLQKDIGKNKLIMNQVIDIYSDIHSILEKHNMTFKYDFNVNLIRLCKFLYLNSSNHV